MVLFSSRAMAREREVSDQGEIEEGSRVVVLNGRHFPSFGAGDQGRVLQVDKEALNCDVLFDGNPRPVPVALRHLRLLKPGRALPVSRTLDFKEEEGKGSKEKEGKDKGKDRDARSRSVSPRRVSIVSEPVAAEVKQANDGCPPSFLHSMDQRLQACETVLDEGSSQSNRYYSKSGRADAVRSGDLNGLEDRIQRIEQRIKDEVDVLNKQLQEAVAFGQSWESRAIALEQHLKSLGHTLSPSPSTRSNLSTRGGAPLYLSAAIPALPQQRLSATPPAKSAPPCAPPTPSTGPCVTQAPCSCGATVIPGSNYCMKCGQSSTPRDPQDGARRSLSATRSGSQDRSYVRAPAYLTARQTTPPRTHMLPGAPPLPPGMTIRAHPETDPFSPASYISGLSATPAPSALTPRLVLPQS